MLKPVPITKRLQLQMRTEICAKTTGDARSARREAFYRHFLVPIVLRLHNFQLIGMKSLILLFKLIKVIKLKKRKITHKLNVQIANLWKSHSS
jgi:hypothetical protein